MYRFFNDKKNLKNLKLRLKNRTLLLRLLRYDFYRIRWHSPYQKFTYGPFLTLTHKRRIKKRCRFYTGTPRERWNGQSLVSYQETSVLSHSFRPPFSWAFSKKKLSEQLSYRPCSINIILKLNFYYNTSMTLILIFLVISLNYFTTYIHLNCISV